PFAELALLLEISIHVLLIAAFASTEDRDFPQPCKARFPPPRRSGSVDVGAGADCCGTAAATASTASTNRYQFRRVVGCRSGGPRQQFPGATWKPGDGRLQSQLSNQPRRRRRLGSRTGSAVSRLG